MKMQYSSLREEALEIAFLTHKDILEGKKDVASTLRSCLVVATNLNKIEIENWIKAELTGYKGDVPKYRNISCRIVDTNQKETTEFELQDVKFSIYELKGVLEEGGRGFHIFFGDKTARLIQQHQIYNLQENIIDECLYFLNDVISELQYGGMVEYLMEEIRKNTDEKLISLDNSIENEIKSLINNLNSSNPADRNIVGHSCRKILKLVADKMFSPSDEQYKMKDGTIYEIKEPQFINRLCAFIDQKTSGDERKFILSEIRHLEDYLKAVVELDQMGEHKPSIEKYQADMMAIHTYLILSEVLKHI